MCQVYGVDFCYQTEDIHYLAVKALPEHKADLTKAATMTLTSGSTGLPKAVVHNVSAHLANAEGVLCLNEFWQRPIMATFLCRFIMFPDKALCGAGFTQVQP